MLTYGIVHLVRTQSLRKTKISYLPVHTRTCAYQGSRKVSFAKNFAYILNGLALVVNALEIYLKVLQYYNIKHV